MPVTGIGGIFFRSDDPKALAAWYSKHLGISTGYEPWQQSAGPTMFTPFGKSTTYFPAEKHWMLNLRVSDLDALLGELSVSGITIVTDPEWNSPETGRFARIHDPEGTAIELWEPPLD